VPVAACESMDTAVQQDMGTNMEETPGVCVKECLSSLFTLDGTGPMHARLSSVCLRLCGKVIPLLIPVAEHMRIPTSDIL